MADSSYSRQSEAEQKRNTLEMLGPDFVDFVKADIAEVKENRFTVNLASDKRNESKNLPQAETQLLEEDE